MMIQKLLAIIVLVMVASLSVAGCTSSTSSNQTAGSTSQAASTTATTAKATAPTGTPKPKQQMPTPLPSASQAQASIMPPVTRIPTSIFIDQLPLAVVPNAPIGGTYQISPYPRPHLTVDVFVNGAYVGQSTTSGENGYFSFPENLPAGHYPITITFPGNAQYGPSSVTGYFDVRPDAGPSPTPHASPTPAA